MDISIGNEILALFLFVIWTFVVMLVSAVWNPKSEFLHHVVVAIVELVGVIAIALICKAPLVGIGVVYALLFGYEHFFSVWWTSRHSSSFARTH